MPLRSVQFVSIFASAIALVAKRATSRLPVIACSLALAACSTAVTPDSAPGSDAQYSAENEVTLYGRHRCPICARFIAALEARGIPYRFFDVDREPQRAREMWTLVNRYYPGNESVGLPVVQVNGTVLIRPAFATFESYLIKLE